MKEKLEQLGYRRFPERGKQVVRSPRGRKVDIYTHDVSGITIDTIYTTAKEIHMQNDTIKVTCVEVLSVAKLRASRPQDIEDIRELCKRHGKSIDWELLKNISTPIELSNIKQTVIAIRK